MPCSYAVPKFRSAARPASWLLFLLLIHGSRISAFWAWRHEKNSWTELDFVEMGEQQKSPKAIDFTSHVFPPTPGVPKQISNSTDVVFGWDPRDDFHVYAMEWNTTLLTWYVDDKIVKVQPSQPFFNQGHAMDVALSFGTYTKSLP